MVEISSNEELDATYPKGEKILMEKIILKVILLGLVIYISSFLFIFAKLA